MQVPSDAAAMPIEYLPATHAKHVSLDVAPVAPEYVPAEHPSQAPCDVAPNMSENVPSGQTWHMVLEVLDANLPAPQS